MEDDALWRRGQAVLLGLGAGALLLGAAREGGRLNKRVELFSSACVLGAALLAWRRDAAQGAVTRRLAQGMACGMAGDLVMGRVAPLPDKAYVPVGMITFGLGHGAYLAAFRALALRRGIWRRGPLVAALALAEGAALAAWQRWVRNDEQALLSYAALAYAALLATMAGVGAGLAAQQRDLAPLAAGGALFVVSDLLIGARLLRGLDFAGRDELIWLTYIAAQALIVWTISGAAGASER